METIKSGLALMVDLTGFLLDSARSRSGHGLSVTS